MPSRSRLVLQNAHLVVATLVSLLASMLAFAIPAQAAACTTSVSTVEGFTTVQFNTPGASCDWTVPAGLYVAEVLVVGGGGGGGAGGGSGSNTAGSGGGGGAVRVLTNQALTPGTTVSVTVGAGGSAGGGPGGTSSIVIASTTSSSVGGVGGVTNAYVQGGAPIGGAAGGNVVPGPGGGNAGGTAEDYSGFKNAGGGGGASSAGSGRNGGAGTVWQAVTYGSGGGGGSFYTSGGTSAANAQGLGGSGAGSGGYWDTTASQLCSYGGLNNRGGGGGGGLANFSCTGSPGGSGTVRLRYAVPNTAIFDANGGSGSMTNQQANTNRALTTNAFTRPGYTFAGWANTPGGSVAYADGANYDFTSNITLYAVWAPPDPPPAPLWTLTYKPNGGTCARASDQAYNAAWITLPDSSSCTRSGFLLTGWNTMANGSGLGFAAGGVTQMTGNNTLYAQWQTAPGAPAPEPSPSASPNPSPSPSPSATLPPAPSPPQTPGSDGAGPIPAPAPLPVADGVTLQPARGNVTAPNAGSVDPLQGGQPSQGASFAGGSIAIWDGTSWVQAYTDPGVGTWLVENGRIRFVPVPGFFGTASTTMRVVDSAGKVGYAPVSFAVDPPAQSTPPGQLEPGSNGLGPIPAPPALSPDAEGVTLPPRSSALDGPVGVVDPVTDAIPSVDATIDRSSLVVWNGVNWVTSIADPSVGAWQVVDGTVAFTPAQGFCGTASTTMKLSDSAGKSGTAPVAFAVPCSDTGSRGSGIVPGPPPPLFDGTTGTVNTGLTLTGVANADGGSVDVAEVLAAFDPDLASMRIWNGKAWVRSFTDPGVGTWKVIGSRIVFTPVRGYSGVVRTTFRVLSGDGSALQGSVTFTVAGGCDLPSVTKIVVGFAPNETGISRADRRNIRRAIARSCSYVVTGYVQPAGSTSNDASLSRSRAEVVSSFIESEKPGTRVRPAAGGRWIQFACEDVENRCVIIRPLQSG